MKNKNASKNKNGTVKHDHPGRPKYALKLPTRKEFTFFDVLKANGVETDPASKNYGKGKTETDPSLLTLRKGLERDMYFHTAGKPIVKGTRTRVNPRSEVCLVHGVTAEPNSGNGLGRRALVYCLRVNKDNVSKAAPKDNAVVAPKAARKTRTPKDASQTPTSDALDAIHKALVTPDPVSIPVPPAVEPVALTVPVVTIVPVPAVVEATPAPVVESESPAPEAVTAEAIAVAVEAVAAAS